MADTFPSWRYGPDGKAEIFNDEGDVPAGWVDHPSKVGKATKPRAKRSGNVK